MTTNASRHFLALARRAHCCLLYHKTSRAGQRAHVELLVHNRHLGCELSFQWRLPVPLVEILWEGGPPPRRHFLVRR